MQAFRIVLWPIRATMFVLRWALFVPTFVVTVIAAAIAQLGAKALKVLWPALRAASEALKPCGCEECEEDAGIGSIRIPSEQALQRWQRRLQQRLELPFEASLPWGNAVQVVDVEPPHPVFGVMVRVRVSEDGLRFPASMLLVDPEEANGRLLEKYVEATMPVLKVRATSFPITMRIPRPS